ncbi:anthrax toxin-like adenylyl cyclase domain-containing protein [Enterobacter ludwigii]
MVGVRSTVPVRDNCVEQGCERANFYQLTRQSELISAIKEVVQTATEAALLAPSEVIEIRRHILFQNSPPVSRNELEIMCQRHDIGILPKHLLRLRKLATAEKIVIGIRPVESVATRLIEQGYPTKGINIKAKSATWGPQAGFICVNQALSKVANNPDQVAMYNREVERCLSREDAVAVPLVVSDAHLNTLLKKKLIDGFQRCGNIRTLSCKTPHQHSYEFQLVSVEVRGTRSPHWRVLLEGKSVEVLGDKTTNKPFTADYDLLLLAPHFELYSSCDMPREEGASRECGNIMTSRMCDLIPKMNKLLSPKKEYILIQHGADCHNPRSDFSANFPAVFVMPFSIEPFREICIIDNPEDFALFIQKVKDSGFVVPINRRWSREVINVRSNSFTEALETIKVRKNIQQQGRKNF